MKKNEYIEMLIQDNETESKEFKGLYDDVIDCTDIALSQEPDTFEVDSKIGLTELLKIISDEGVKRSRENKCVGSVGPFEAAELIAKKLGATYTRPSRRSRSQASAVKVNLEDFF